MVTISVERAGDRFRVELNGRLAAADLKALERACRFALEHKIVPLELHLEHVTAIDQAARAYLDRLSARGARIVGLREPARARVNGNE